MTKIEKTNKPIAKILQSSISELQNIRIIQKNLLYVIGLSASICDREVFKKIKKPFNEKRIFQSIWEN